MTASTDSPARVLVVDDERSIVELVATALRYEGFQVETAATGREALRSVASWRPDLVVLDVMLPDLDGHEVHRRLDGSTPVPILYLTARDATEDKVRGLTLGADDYVTKPFSLEELVARVRSVLRRTRPDTSTSGRLELHDLVLDEDTHEVTRAGRAIELTPTEFNLLRYLLVNARRVVSKSQILDHVWQYDFGGDTNIVETYISYLSYLGRGRLQAGRGERAGQLADERVLADLVQRGERADAQLVPVPGDAAQLVQAADVDHAVRGRDAQPEPVEQLGAARDHRRARAGQRPRRRFGCARAGVGEVPHRPASSRAAASTAAVICG